MITRRHRRHFVAVALLAFVLVAPDLGARTFANNDEARFPVLARGILAGASWLMPTLNGVPYSNKPPLLAWLIALASWPAGHVTQFTAVVPSALAAVGTILAVQALGTALFGLEAGTLAALVAMTTQGVFLHARIPMPDMLMTCFMTVSMWAFWRMARNRNGPNWIGFYGAMAAAFWTKGLAGLAPLAIDLVWSVVSKEPERWRRLQLVPGLAVLASVIAPWWLVTAVSGGGRLKGAVVTDQLGWYLVHPTRISTATAPLENVFAILFPWILAVPLALAHAHRFLRGRGVERDNVAFVLTWSAATAVLAALSGEQRLRYYLPLVPPVALFIGWWWASLVARRSTVHVQPWRPYVATASALGVVLLAIVLWRGRWMRDLPLVMPTSMLELIAVGGALALIVVALVRGVRGDRLAPALRLVWCATAVLVVVGYHANVQRRNRLYDYPRLSAEIGPIVREAPAVLTLGVHDLPLSLYIARSVAPVAARDLRRMTVVGTVVVLADDNVAALSPGATVIGHSSLGARGFTVARSGGAAWTEP